MARILVADDNAEVAQFISRSLTRDGHDVVTVPDGKQAIDHMAREVFDLLITDVVMPDVGGLDVLRSLRKTAPEARIVAMSGGGRGSAAQYLELAQSFGATVTIEKPFSVAELNAAVAAALAH
jgi:DNA-binding response OmpR family regulator